MATQWYYQIDGSKLGPVSSSQLRQLAQTSQLRRTDLVQKEGMTTWAKAGDVGGLFLPVALIAETPQQSAHAKEELAPIELVQIEAVEPVSEQKPVPDLAAAAKDLFSAVKVKAQQLGTQAASAAKDFAKSVQEQAVQSPSETQSAPPISDWSSPTEPADQQQRSSRPPPLTQPTTPPPITSAKVSRKPNRMALLIGLGAAVIALPVVLCCGMVGFMGSIPGVGSTGGTNDTGQLQSFEDIPPPIQVALKDGKDVWELKGWKVVHDDDKRGSLYVVLDGDRLTKLVSKFEDWGFDERLNQRTDFTRWNDEPLSKQREWAKGQSTTKWTLKADGDALNLTFQLDQENPTTFTINSELNTTFSRGQPHDGWELNRTSTTSIHFRPRKRIPDSTKTDRETARGTVAHLQDHLEHREVEGSKKAKKTNNDAAKGLAKHKPPADLRAVLIETAERIEGPFSEVVEDIIQSVEEGDCPMSVADDRMNGLGLTNHRFSTETMAAYRAWRAAKLAEPNKPKRVADKVAKSRPDEAVIELPLKPASKKAASPQFIPGTVLEQKEGKQLVFPVTGATLHGAARLDKSGHLVGFASDEDFVSWDFIVTKPGRFDFLVKYTVVPTVKDEIIEISVGKEKSILRLTDQNVSGENTFRLDMLKVGRYTMFVRPKRFNGSHAFESITLTLDPDVIFR